LRERRGEGRKREEWKGMIPYEHDLKIGLSCEIILILRLMAVPFDLKCDIAALEA